MDNSSHAYHGPETPGITSTSARTPEPTPPEIGRCDRATLILQLECSETRNLSSNALVCTFYRFVGIGRCPQ